MVGVIVAGAATAVVVELGRREPPDPEAVHLAVGAEAVLCAKVGSAPAEAASDGLQRGPAPQIEQDPRCDELAGGSGPGEVSIPRHREATPGNVVLVVELGFDEQQRCFYVLAGDGPIGVVWPARFIGRDDPPRITDDRGATVVAIGDRFEVRGRYAPGVGDRCGPVDGRASEFIASDHVVLTGGS